MAKIAIITKIAEIARIAEIPKIGEIAMRHTAEKSNVDPTIVSCPDAQRFMLMTPQVFYIFIY